LLAGVAAFADAHATFRCTGSLFTVAAVCMLCGTEANSLCRPLPSVCTCTHTCAHTCVHAHTRRAGTRSGLWPSQATLRRRSVCRTRGTAAKGSFPLLGA
jgi:hypothetical protein